MKAKRSFYNITFGFLSQAILIAFGFIVPRLFILKLGSEVNGFMSSINQVLVYMSLLEAGVGAATIQALYKPLTLDDKEGMNGILSATSNYYKKTGMFYFLAVVAASIVYPLAVPSNIGFMTMSAVILLTGLVGVQNYFFQAKYKLLLSAEGKGYITTNIAAITTILTNIGKIVLLYLNFNIILIQTLYFLVNFLQVFLLWIYINKHYMWINLRVPSNYTAISQKRAVLIHQVSGMIFSNTDVLVLTAFCGLKVVSVYVMYNLIFQMVNSIIGNINSGVTFVLGAAYCEDKKKFLRIYEAYEVYCMAIVFALFSVTYIFILPFMKIYTAGITDMNYIDAQLPILFVTVYILSASRMPALTAITVAGHFKATQYRAIWESAINIIVSLALVNIFGIYGVLYGTIAALIYRTNDVILYTSRHILNRSPFLTYRRWLINTILFLLVVLTADRFSLVLRSYGMIAAACLISLLAIVPLFVFTASIFERSSFSVASGYLRIFVHNFKMHLKKSENI